LVSFEDLGDCSEKFALLGAEPGVDGKVKGGGVPKVAPLPGEDGCPHAKLEGEEGHDDAQHLFEERADEVEAH
jgi:hypothetical protein